MEIRGVVPDMIIWTDRPTSTLPINFSFLALNLEFIRKEEDGVLMFVHTICLLRKFVFQQS
jgi:hypothetical protein